MATSSAVRLSEKNRSEGELIRLAKARNLQWKRAPRNADMHEHWDVALLFPTKAGGTRWVRFDVKGRKEDGRILVEHANVRGNPGWLNGQADYLAFEMEDHFLMVKRVELKELADSLVGDWKLARIQLRGVTSESYKAYRRADRPLERIAYLEVEDVERLPNTSRIAKVQSSEMQYSEQ